MGGGGSIISTGMGKFVSLTFLLQGKGEGEDYYVCGGLLGNHGITFSRIDEQKVEGGVVRVFEVSACLFKVC